MQVETTFYHNRYKYRVYTRNKSKGQYVTYIHRTDLETQRTLMVDKTTSNTKNEALWFHGEMIQILLKGDN